MASLECLCLSDFEEYARKTISKFWFQYFYGGADAERTVKENIRAFRRYQIFPRVLCDVSEIKMNTTILGYPISFPVCIAPTAQHAMAHPQGEVGTARGAMSMRIGFTQSMYSNRTIDEVSDAAGDCLKFIQLQILSNREIFLRLVKLAEKRDYKAIILTVDDQKPGNRVSWERVAKDFGTVPELKFGNFDDQHTPSIQNNYLIDKSTTWQDIHWLKSQTRLPIILKGILNDQDAALAVEAGVAGILVSNHGGRQLDSSPATIDALDEIVKAVKGRCEVYLDGGIRHGTDVLKALALGARVVFIGRPAVYALAFKGEDGVRQMLQILKNELSTAMGLAGCASVDDLSSVTIRLQKSHL